LAGLRKILLVEDNLELRNLYEIFLKQHGFDVAIASDGDEGLEKAKEYKPDLIFLDVMMPKKNGFEVLKILRHDPSYGCTKTKIVILTNLGDSSKVSPDVRADMDGYVIKAEIELRSLLEIIKSFDHHA
jgi:two-component system alkaline phosphatase synthesis response regulator PhoP